MAMKLDGLGYVFGLEDGTIELWEKAKPKPVKCLGPLQGHSDLVRVVDLSPHYLISGSWDASIKLWCRNSGKILHEFASEDGPVSGLYLNEALNCVLFSARAGKVRKLQLDSFELAGKFEMDHGDCIIDMSVDGQRVLTGGSDAKLNLFTFHEGTTMHSDCIFEGYI